MAEQEIVIAGVDEKLRTAGVKYVAEDLLRFGYTVLVDPSDIRTEDERSLIIRTAANGVFCDECGAVFFIGDDSAEAGHRLICDLTGHTHLRIIGNRWRGETAFDRLAKEVRSFLGVPEPLEIERKFLIECPCDDLLKNLDYVSPAEISQTYLNYESGERARVRRRSARGVTKYYHTVKKKITDTRRIEIERILTEEEYQTFLDRPVSEKYTLTKTRYCVSYDSQYFELDVYPFMKDEALLEIELCREDDEIQFPEWVKVIREVTSDKSYSNYSMAKKVTEGKYKNEAY